MFEARPSVAPLDESEFIEVAIRSAATSVTPGTIVLIVSFRLVRPFALRFRDDPSLVVPKA